MAIPDNAIQTIGLMTDLPKVLNAKYLIVHKDIKDYGVMRFERSGAHFPMGIKQNRYFGCLIPMGKCAPERSNLITP